MGFRNTVEQQAATLAWAEGFQDMETTLPDRFSPSGVVVAFKAELDRYFALCGLARHKYAPGDLVSRASAQLFRVRTAIEASIMTAVGRVAVKRGAVPEGLLVSSFYGKSKKQGVSVRMPLTTCEPTAACKDACYAHDALDAAPNSMVRGALNGAIAAFYEVSSSTLQGQIMKALETHTRRAVSHAISEASALQPAWSRRPRIRFAHVGEVAATPRFANAIAAQVSRVSKGLVICAAYTRHPRARELDSDLWVLNFTIDASDERRNQWAPAWARTVGSAFGGRLSSRVDVNFLEHHPWFHAAPSGRGVVCPATLPEAAARSCDGVRCDRCFRPRGAGTGQTPAATQTPHSCADA